MNKYLELDSWKIIERGFDPDNQLLSESIFSLGNGYFGQRANFEERYSGDSLQGSYFAGVYYPDKTLVGWWKIGYPEYYAKVLNSTNWFGIDIKIDGEILDLYQCGVEDFIRTLNMKEGYLKREFKAELEGGRCIKVEAKRFISMARPEIAVICYSMKALNFSGNLEITPYLDGDVENQDANYGEKFWDGVAEGADDNQAYVMLKTKKEDFYICSYMNCKLFLNKKLVELPLKKISREKYAENCYNINLNQGDEIILEKYLANTSSRYYDSDKLVDAAEKLAREAAETGFENLMKEQAVKWAEKWEKCDVKIKGDTAAQQGIRFNIFQLNQIYTGEDERLNIGPKGFTGEKYGGSTYWDTEAYCLPYYMSTAGKDVARNLLLYRYNHLDKAVENAEKLGFSGGAALYPMVTMNGEESHNEWEITFEEIHRNGAVAYAIYNYVNYTGDKSYLADYGLEVLIAISRFWAQRVNMSLAKDKYVILGVTGPNEYENNVNNNWYTNRIAVWTLEYTLEVRDYLQQKHPKQLKEIEEELALRENELQKWQDIINKMYYPVDEERGIFLQQDNYLDKEQIMVHELDEKDLPLNQNWSWDRILRSCFVKQADVLQGLYFLEDKYDLDTIKNNFKFYEPRTVHESSLSPSIHAVLAAKIGDYEKAYQMYLRTARLDLENINNDTEDGCHITSMAGTWMAVVQGFGGLRVRDDKLILNPFLPEQWDSYSFKVLFRGGLIKIEVIENKVIVYYEIQEDDLQDQFKTKKDSNVDIRIYGDDYNLSPGMNLEIEC